ncbi:homocysteine S-methyltransferase family protein [Mailhella massiliensis]|uniref:Homocysteine S-methyltransferase family protein n=1 Tax=Mailhella massiliensis TaxID=1903261 RepID=A0A921AXF4_9BACT|nr:homocysteine S-methyltransferase family protein [Mailhella massiliensis]HJD97913.1 homocysteine S-methyltransferase family protein [Mailhella massiliensis]
MKERESRGEALKQCWNTSPLFLMEGALSERLKHEFHLPTEGPAGMAGLVREKKGREALAFLWKQYLAIACKYSLPFLAATPTRRCDKERASSAGFIDKEGRSSIFKENMALLREVQDEADRKNALMFAGGMLGCKGDAYTGKGCLSTTKALELHRWQAGLFREAGADFLYAALMPSLTEALGMAQAMAETGLPFIISFTLRADGRLADGTPLYAAIDVLDAEISPRPLCFMANCVHPALVRKALSAPFNRTPLVRSRFLGIQANASPLSFRELEGSKVTMQSEPENLAKGMLRLKNNFGLRIFGGCCGTTDRHMEAIASALCQKASPHLPSREKNGAEDSCTAGNKGACGENSGT